MECMCANVCSYLYIYSIAGVLIYDKRKKELKIYLFKIYSLSFFFFVLIFFFHFKFNNHLFITQTKQKKT